MDLEHTQLLLVALESPLRVNKARADLRITADPGWSDGELSPVVTTAWLRVTHYDTGNEASWQVAPENWQAVLRDVKQLLAEWTEVRG